MSDHQEGFQCRSCLTSNAPRYIDMESSMSGNLSYLECFRICTNLKATSSEEMMPTTICSSCCHDLQVAFDFVQTARQADAELREALQLRKDSDSEKLSESIRVELINELEGEVDYLDLPEDDDSMVLVEDTKCKEIETEEEQIFDDMLMEMEYLDDKPQLENFVVELQDDHSKYVRKKEPLLKAKEESQDYVESYPEDEVDGEYMIEYSEGDNVEVSAKEDMNVETLEPQSSKWKCIECKRILRGDVSYEGHMNMHKKTKPYKCTQCKSAFRCKSALDRHASRRHDVKAVQKCFSCDLCDKVFRLSTLLLEHRRAEHKMSESCPRCSKPFKSEEALHEHLALIHAPDNISVQCPYCEESSLPRARVAEHLRMHHPIHYRQHFHTVGRPCDENKVTPWQCEECFRYYRTEALLKDHRNIHTNERPHMCAVCEKRFSTANNLRSHMRSMHQVEYEKRVAESLETMVKCNICNRNLLKKNFEKHMTSHERKERESADGSMKYLCAYCPKSFCKQSKLNKHEEVHNPQRTRNHECDYCESKFFTSFDKIHHERRVHLGNERAFVCTVCGNAFKEKSQLRNHVQLHMNKNIQCPHCEKKYARQTDLTVHLRSHTGELPYACDLCDKRFAIKVRLTYHLQKHMGVKHKCNLCGAMYNSRGKLRMHMFNHTGMPYRCEHSSCPNAQFSKRERYRLHMSRVHNETPSEDDITANFERNTGKTIRIRDVSSYQYSASQSPANANQNKDKLNINVD